MAKIRVKVPVGAGSVMEIELNSQPRLEHIKAYIADHLNIPQSKFQLLKNPEAANSAYALVPANIEGAIDEELLRDEYAFLRHQFPLVQMKSLTLYEGMVRCEGGPIKELAEDRVWPFEQYMEWHKFKIKLSFLHPYKPPTVTWLTDIDHPNIIPKRSGKVCVSVLGKGWLPQTKLAAVVNALYFLLYDPNPYSHYPNKRCKKAAEICKAYGFPRKRKIALPRHDNAITCPNCRRPFILEDPEAKVIQCIHCKIILRRRLGESDEEDDEDDDYDEEEI